MLHHFFAPKVPFVGGHLVAFVELDGVPEPIRVRFAHVTDDHIHTLAAGWRPPTSLPQIDDEAA